MGVNCPNVTKCLHKILSDGSTVKKDFYAEFEPTHFAAGTFRYCFKGKLKTMVGNKIKTGDFPSGLCVVKAYKNAAYTQEYLIDFIGSKYAYNEALIWAF